MDVVNLWSERTNINDNPRAGRPLTYTEDLQLKLIAFYCQTTPLPDCGRWTLRWAESHLEKDSNLVGMPISHSSIGRILKKHNLKPHLLKYFLHISDPYFFPKMIRIINLYMNRPEYLFSLDECPGIQILRRLAPDLQIENTKKTLKEFEYKRNGTLDVIAILNVKDGQIFAECHDDHKIPTLLGVFERHLKTLPKKETKHYIMDNLASHSSYAMCKLVADYSNIKCPSEKELNTAVKRREWLQSENKRIIFHYTPFHGSWLNMVEIWFGILNQKCLKESFDSPESIYEAIDEFCKMWNMILAHPFKWDYTGEGLHQKVVDRFINMLENGMNKLEITIITKQLNLMANLIEDYRDEVHIDSWLKLNELITAKREELYNIILADDGPKKVPKAKAALSRLNETLSLRINQELAA